MKFSIGALILLTLIAGIVANVWTQRERIARAHAAIEVLERDIKQLNFDEASMDSHIHVCETAIANNPSPSQYFLDAEKRLEELEAIGKEQDK